MVKLFDLESGQELGTITDTQFQFLAERLEEESSDDRDYYLNRETLAMFEGDGAEPALLATLRQALGDRDEADIRWERLPG
jgi:hypothetical protein